MTYSLPTKVVLNSTSFLSSGLINRKTLKSNLLVSRYNIAFILKNTAFKIMEIPTWSQLMLEKDSLLF